MQRISQSTIKNSTSNVINQTTHGLNVGEFIRNSDPVAINVINISVPAEGGVTKILNNLAPNYYTKMGETFTASENITITTANAPLKRTGIISGNIRASIYNTRPLPSEPTPTSIVGSSDWVDVTTIDILQDNVGFTFSTTVDIFNGTTYALVIETDATYIGSADGSNYLEIYYQDSDVWPGGVLSEYNENSTTWSNITGEDLGCTLSGTTVGGWIKALADTKDHLATYVVSEVLDADTFITMDVGTLNIPTHGYTVNSKYYLSPINYGEPTSTLPMLEQYLFTVLDADNILINLTKIEGLGNSIILSSGNMSLHPEDNVTDNGIGIDIIGGKTDRIENTYSGGSINISGGHGSTTEGAESGGGGVVIDGGDGHSGGGISISGGSGVEYGGNILIQPGGGTTTKGTLTVMTGTGENLISSDADGNITLGYDGSQIEVNGNYTVYNAIQEQRPEIIRSDIDLGTIYARYEPNIQEQESNVIVPIPISTTVTRDLSFLTMSDTIYSVHLTCDITFPNKSELIVSLVAPSSTEVIVYNGPVVGDPTSDLHIDSDIAGFEDEPVTPTYPSGLDVDTIVWQSGTTVRYTFLGSPDLSTVTVGMTLDINGAVNRENDGSYIISAVNDGSDYIEVTNPLVTSPAFDEGPGSSATADVLGTGLWTLKIENTSGANTGSSDYYGLDIMINTDEENVTFFWDNSEREFAVGSTMQSGSSNISEIILTDYYDFAAETFIAYSDKDRTRGIQIYHEDSSGDNYAHISTASSSNMLYIDDFDELRVRSSTSNPDNYASIGMAGADYAFFGVNDNTRVIKIEDDYGNVNVGDGNPSHIDKFRSYWDSVTVDDGVNHRSFLSTIIKSGDASIRVLIIGDLNVNNITWQSGNTIRYTFSDSPDLSGIDLTFDTKLVVTGATNAVNDGKFVVTAFDDTTKWIEITNDSRTSGADDETSSPATAEARKFGGSYQYLYGTLNTAQSNIIGCTDRAVTGDYQRNYVYGIYNAAYQLSGNYTYQQISNYNINQASYTDSYVHSAIGNYNNIQTREGGIMNTAYGTYNYIYTRYQPDSTGLGGKINTSIASLNSITAYGENGVAQCVSATMTNGGRQHSAWGINNITWQSGNTIRITFDSAFTGNVYTGYQLLVSGATNASNDGRFFITNVDVSKAYVDINNPSRSDATDDETGSSAVTDIFRGVITGDTHLFKGLYSGVNDTQYQGTRYGLYIENEEINFIEGSVGIGVNAPEGKLEISTSTTIGTQAVTIDQNDVLRAFIDYQGTSSVADPSNPLLFPTSIVTGNGTGGTVTGQIQGPYSSGDTPYGWRFVGMVQKEINGVPYFMPYYQWSL